MFESFLHCVLWEGERACQKIKHFDWIVCGIIPNTILIINSHPLAFGWVALDFGFLSFVPFRSFIRRMCTTIVFQLCTILMHQFSFLCATIVLYLPHSLVFTSDIRYCNVRTTLNWWGKNNDRQKEIIFDISTIENNSMEIFRKIIEMRMKKWQPATKMK